MVGLLRLSALMPAVLCYVMLKFKVNNGRPAANSNKRLIFELNELKLKRFIRMCNEEFFFYTEFKLLVKNNYLNRNTRTVTHLLNYIIHETTFKCVEFQGNH